MAPHDEKKLVPVAYWRCWCKEHSHRSRDAAARCISKHEEPKKPFEQAVEDLWETPQYLDILAALKAGKSTSQIGKDLRASAHRVKELIHIAKCVDRFKAFEPSLDELSGRTRNCLATAQLLTLEDVAKAAHAGLLRSLPGMGRLGAEEVRLWCRPRTAAPPNAAADAIAMHMTQRAAQMRIDVANRSNLTLGDKRILESVFLRSMGPEHLHPWDWLSNAVRRRLERGGILNMNDLVAAMATGRSEHGELFYDLLQVEGFNRQCGLETFECLRIVEQRPH